MKGFEREDSLFSLCGLNCALCAMSLDGYCPGCGRGVGNQGCPIARCSLERSGVQYCYECKAYPCDKYDGITQYDSFITHRNQLSDMARARTIGIEAYDAELRERADILKALLRGFNDGRRKTFFTLAVNLLSLEELRAAMAQLENALSEDASAAEKAAASVKLLEDIAAKRGIALKLNKKPRAVK